MRAEGGSLQLVSRYMWILPSAPPATHRFLYLVIITSAGSQVVSPLIRYRWGREAHPGVGMVLPGPADLACGPPADIWPQVPRGSPSARGLAPPSPKLHLCLPPASTPCSSSHSPWRFLLYFLSPMSLTHLHDWFPSARPQCTHSYMLYTVTRAHTHPHKPTPFTCTQKHLHTCTHPLTRLTHSRMCTHSPSAPDTHSCTFSHTLIHSHTHVP